MPSGSPAPAGSPALGSISRSDPDLTADDVLVEVEGCVLGSPEIAALGAESREPDIIPGGAVVGVVVAAGENARHAMGARVVVGPEQPCGECDICRRGGAVCCPRGRILGRTMDGGLASHVVAGARWLCAIDGELAIPGPAACLVGRELAWAYAMFARASVAPGEPVVIIGSDGDIVARFLVEVAIARGVRPMVILGHDQEEFARWLRARDATAIEIPTSDLNATEDAAGSSGSRDAVAAIVTRAADAAGFGQRPWTIFETSAAPGHRDLAHALVGPAATLVLLAGSARGRDQGDTAAGSHGLAFEALARANATCIGVAGAHPDLLPETAALVVRGAIDLDTAAAVCPIDEVTDAHLAPPPRDPPRVQIVTPGGAG